MYLSIGYIHRYCTGPASNASSAKCIGKCSIMSKKDGGKIFSRWQSVSEIRSWSLCRSFFELTFEHNILKKFDSSIRASTTCFGKSLLTASGSNCCKIIWLSWLFKPQMLCSFRWTHREILDAYPSGTLRSFNNFKNWYFSSFPNVKQAGGSKILLELVSWGCKGLMFNSLRSSRAFKWSFVFPTMPKSDLLLSPRITQHLW